jgi:RND family efflux transporter MFP subunit
MRLAQLLSTAAITIVWLFTAGCKRSAAEEHGNTPLATVAVKTAVVSEVDAPVTLRLAGSLRGMHETDLAANATGRVVSTTIERGMQVKVGQVLAQLDVRQAANSASEANAQAETARATAAQAKLECSRAEQLKASGAISQAELDRLQSQCRTSSLGVEVSAVRAQMAAQNVGDGSVRAPFAGVVTERYVDVGEFVRTDSRVVTIVSIDTLRLELAVPEADASKVKEDAEVGFHVATFPDRRFVGKVRFVSGAIRASTRDLVVEALVDNADRALMPGMFADIEFNVGRRKLAGIPKDAVLEKDGRARAFFVVDGRIEERVLSTLPEVVGAVPVLKGAKAGESVVLGDLRTLTNGQRVR